LDAAKAQLRARIFRVVVVIVWEKPETVVTSPVDDFGQRFAPASFLSFEVSYQLGLSFRRTQNGMPPTFPVTANVPIIVDLVTSSFDLRFYDDKDRVQVQSVTDSVGSDKKIVS
jgi:hypothetical protein